MRKNTPSDKMPKEPVAESKRVPSMHDVAKHLIVDDPQGPSDLATNPKYFDDFGLDRSQRSAKR
jgi:hypothetical protein